MVSYRRFLLTQKFFCIKTAADIPWYEILQMPVKYSICWNWVLLSYFAQWNIQLTMVSLMSVACLNPQAYRLFVRTSTLRSSWPRVLKWIVITTPNPPFIDAVTKVYFNDFWASLDKLSKKSADDLFRRHDARVMFLYPDTLSTRVICVKPKLISNACSGKISVTGKIHHAKPFGKSILLRFYPSFRIISLIAGDEAIIRLLRCQ